MIKKTVKKKKVEKSEEAMDAQEYAVCLDRGDECCDSSGGDCANPAEEGGACEVGTAQRVSSRVLTKKFHGDRLKLLVEVCEKWCLFGEAWKTKFARDAHALIDLGLLEYVKSDNGYMQVRPTEEGLERYKTIVAGVFGDEVSVA